jgi:hypothetical protein
MPALLRGVVHAGAETNAEPDRTARALKIIAVSSVMLLSPEFFMPALRLPPNANAHL